jgi:hypothetical protein
MTPLERQLAATPRREPPAALRDRVLAAAREARREKWRARFAWMWPHPLAWAAVAGAWTLIAAINLAGPRGDALYAVTPAAYRDRMPDAREYLARLEAERRLLARLEAESRETARYFRSKDL